MKKQTALALAAVFAMSVAGTALAAPNAFADVPAKHWAYDSVSKLAQAGVISGYGDGTYKGDKTLTRYEIAVIIAKAMNNTDKMDAPTKAALDKLQAEFSSELNNLGVRIDNVEKKLGNVKFSGDVRMRYVGTEKETAAGVKSDDDELKARTRIYATAQVGDKWTFTTRLQNISNYKDTDATDSDIDMNMAYASGKVLGGVYNFGRQEVKVLDGLVLDNTGYSEFKGAVVAYDLGGVKATARYGNQENDFAAADGAYEDKYTNLELKGKVGAINLGGAYHKISERQANADDVKIWEVAASTKLSPVFTLSAGYAKSDVDGQDKAYTYKVAYKTFDKSQQGSSAAWVQYRNTGSAALYNTTYDVAKVGTDGSKAFEAGFDYAPWKNVQFETYYVSAEAKTSDATDKRLYSFLRYWF